MVKTCTKCQIEKPFSEFRKNSSRKDLLCVQCKTCMTQHLRAWEKANPEKVRATCQRGYKKNKEKKDAANRKWCAENPDRVRELARLRARRNYTPEKGAKWAAENPERAKANTARWARGTPDRRCANENARRAGKLRATPSWADASEIARVYALAAKMAKHLDGPYHVDHVVPLKSKLVCGLHVHQNLRVLRGDLNAAKGNRFNPMTFDV